LLRAIHIHTNLSHPQKISNKKPLQTAPFGAHRGVAACFATRRSLNPHPWLLLPP
jgi:hypothetical protein